MAQLIDPRSCDSSTVDEAAQHEVHQLLRDAGSLDLSPCKGGDSMPLGGIDILTLRVQKLHNLLLQVTKTNPIDVASET